MSTDLMSYRPGSWFGIFGENASVLLPPSEKRRVAALWELVDDGAGFGEILDALIASGLRDLPGFVLVSTTDGTTQVVLRGPATATFVSAGESVTLDGASASTWVERSLADVTGFRVDLEESAEGAGTDGLTISGGLARVGRVSSGQPDPAPDPTPDPTPEPAASPSVVAFAEEPALEPATAEAEPAAEPGPAAEPEPAAAEPLLPPPYEPPAEPTEDGVETDTFAAVDQGETDGPDVTDGTWAEPPGSYADVDGEPLVSPTAPPGSYSDVEGSAPLSTVAPPGSYADVEGAAPLSTAAPAGHYTDSRAKAPSVDDGSDEPVEPPSWGAPPPAYPPAPPAGESAVAEAPPESEEHDGMTRSGAWEPGQFARQQPGIPGQPPAPSITSRPVARLTLSHGEVVDVDRAILIGRAPEARRFSSTDQPRLVTVPSPNQEISSTHLEIRPGSGVDHGTAVVTDMGSTNGTVLVQPGLAPEDLQPGIPVQLYPGAVIDLGDGVTITVANP